MARHAHDDERAGVANTRRHMEMVFFEPREQDPIAYEYDPHDADPKPQPTFWQMLRLGMLGGLVIVGLGWFLLEVAARR